MLKIVLAILAFCPVVAIGEALAEDSVNVHVTVEGFRSDDGICRLLLFANKKGFPDSGSNAVAMLSTRIHGRRGSFTVRMRPGRYAIAILHDENANASMDKTWYGKPKEGFGASGNPKVGFGPPGFEESAVSLDEKNNHLTIMVNYL
jgi:uncharacterized protein (DUF2141 family)